jgi:hypothetical protein
MPEFKGLRVYAGKDGETVETKREMTVRDLMRHTSGLTYGVPNGSPVDKLYIANKIESPGDTLADMVMYLETGSSSPSLPSSISTRAPAEVIGLVKEWMRKMASGDIAVPVLTSFLPMASSRTTFPCRATSTTTPAVWFLSTVACTRDLIRSSFSADMPTTSGIACVNSSARPAPRNRHPDNTAHEIALTDFLPRSGTISTVEAAARLLPKISVSPDCRMQRLF